MRKKKMGGTGDDEKFILEGRCVRCFGIVAARAGGRGGATSI